MNKVTCCVCGELFAITEETRAVLQRSQQTIHCPWGHRLRVKTEKEIKQKMQEMQQQAEKQKKGDLTVIEGGKK